MRWNGWLRMVEEECHDSCVVSAMHAAVLPGFEFDDKMTPCLSRCQNWCKKHTKVGA